MASRAKLQCFFDVLSPYSRIAFEVLTRYRTAWPSVDISFVPMFLGGVMGMTGNQPPGMVPAKAKHMRGDLHLLERYYDLQPPFRMPEDVAEALLVKGSLSSMRFLVSLHNKHPELFEPAARELWIRRWSRDQDIHTTENLLEVCKVIGLDLAAADDVVAHIEHKDVKSTLMDNTKRAVIEHGAFGAPWIVVTKADGETQCFFGTDRFPQIAWTLGLEYPGAMRPTNAKL